MVTGSLPTDFVSSTMLQDTTDFFNKSIARKKMTEGPSIILKYAKVISTSKKNMVFIWFLV